jgi:uncharacterized protein (TIGR03435 family)
MGALWQRGALSIREIQETFPEKGRPIYAKVQTVVYRLEAKQAVRRTRRVGNADIFEAVVSRDAARGRRVEAIMRGPLLDSLKPTRKLLLACAAVVAIVAPIAIGNGRAQSQAAPLRFEVATVKPARGGKGSLQISPGGVLMMGGVTLKGLVAMAYGMTEDQIKGGPAWMASEAWQVVAKPEQPDSGGASAAPGNAGWRRMQERLRSLLAERFLLVVHKDAKAASVFALVVKDAARLQPTKQEGVPAGTMRSATQIVGRAGTMQMLATVLTNWLGRTVEDRTGLTGSYDYTLTYAADPRPLEDSAPADPAGAPSILTALQEQLGLKLEPARGSIETLVIDHVQKPTAN